ncbi:MAG: YdcF family protein [Bacteroidetes bacterium]|nr:YdcF family protein [Bacteroidota bacterium]
MKCSLSTPAVISCAIVLLCSFNKTAKESEDLNKELSNPYDVIIVPGVPYQKRSMKMVLKARILWAKYLFERGITKNIIFSGASVYTPYVESKVMKIYADSLGLPTKNIFCEEEAEHSTENVFYSVQLAKEQGFKRIGLATDPYQALLLGRYIKNSFPEIEIITIKYENIDMKSKWPEINAESAFSESFVSLVKRENRFKRLKGTMGMNIIDNKKDSSIFFRRVPLFAKY